MACSIARSLDVIGEPWVGMRRFDEIVDLLLVLVRRGDHWLAGEISTLDGPGAAT